MKKSLFILWMLCASVMSAMAETGYELWLRYVPVDDNSLRKEYMALNKCVVMPGNTSVIEAARSELQQGLAGMLGQTPRFVDVPAKGALVVGKFDDIRQFVGDAESDKVSALGDEGYMIYSTKAGKNPVTVITSLSDKGVLYGVFRYLRQMQTHDSLAGISISDAPKLTYRVLNHWDNINGTVERGYAGYSLWNWEHLPDIVEPRYTDYARANASIGINGIVLNNVNAKAESLRHDWLVKAAAIADAFRPYGIRVYLTAKFSAPKEIGGLGTANPRDERVQKWWRDKADEIYSVIPDFGGFLVKANSEGQPGPQDYGCSHAEGANMLADALRPHNGIVFWRAFVYQNERHVDRVITGYREFKPFDGQFASNVFVQPKNGPIDFQPREPFHPLFGAMPQTPLAMEVQITQENLGHAGHLVYLGPLYEEVLKSDTSGDGTTVSDVLKGYNRSHGMSAIAGVPNVGTDINWTGHPFGQANWYAFGRLAWNPDDKAGEIADDWVRMTFTNNPADVSVITDIMGMSRETYVNYTMPLGLTHIMNFGSHNGPEPWHDDPVWTAFDYHKVTADSIGVDRTMHGSKATGQYAQAVGSRFDSLETCPDEYLLWFHRLPFGYKMRSGRTLWDEIVLHYYNGVGQVDEMIDKWDTLRGHIDAQRFSHVASLLQHQKSEAEWWRDGCVLFFQSYSGMPLPAGCSKPAHSLKYYKTIPFPYDWNGHYGE